MSVDERPKAEKPERGKKGIAVLDLDKVIHERSRLLILTHLASGEDPETSFTALKEALGLSAGNLSVQLKTLEEAGYVKIAKRFVGNKPFTGTCISVEGMKALSAYLAEMETLVAALKSGAARRDEEG